MIGNKLFSSYRLNTVDLISAKLFVTWDMRPFTWRNATRQYYWWKKSCARWCSRYPSIHRVLYIPGGAGITSINSIMVILKGNGSKSPKMNPSQVAMMRKTALDDVLMATFRRITRIKCMVAWTKPQENPAYGILHGKKQQNRTKNQRLPVTSQSLKHFAQHFAQCFGWNIRWSSQIEGSKTCFLSPFLFQKVSCCCWSKKQ